MNRMVGKCCGEFDHLPKILSRSDQACIRDAARDQGISQDAVEAMVFAAYGVDILHLPSRHIGAVVSAIVAKVARRLAAEQKLIKDKQLADERSAADLCKRNALDRDRINKIRSDKRGNYNRKKKEAKQLRMSR